MSLPSSTSFVDVDDTTRFAAVRTLCLRWQAARRDGQLPFYEEVALGSLGLVADDLALVQPSSDGRLVFLRGGAGVTKLLDRPLAGVGAEELEANYRDAFTTGLRRALADRRPTLTLARRVFDGLIATVERRPAPAQSVVRRTRAGLPQAAAGGQQSRRSHLQGDDRRASGARGPQHRGRLQRISDRQPQRRSRGSFRRDRSGHPLEAAVASRSAIGGP